jgi:hypothetical protein
MDIRLIDKHWEREFSSALNADKTSLRIICPFIKQGALTSFLAQHRIPEIQVITRYNLAEFAQKVSDTAALRLLLKRNAQIRGIKNLHAKVFLFGKKRAIITSANLTDAALNRNHELGLSTDDPLFVSHAQEYFEKLWRQRPDDLDQATIDRWDNRIAGWRNAGGSTTKPKGLGDEGADAGFAAESPAPTLWAGDSKQAFVKFLGQGSDRVPLSFKVGDEIRASDCHWGLCYPAAQRPRSVQDGAHMFIGRLTTEHPTDIRVFGRALAMSHMAGRDDATREDIQKFKWKKTWPRYIRVSNAEFVAGDMSNGISLNELMAKFGADSFEVTSRQKHIGKGNTNPRRAYARKPQIELTPMASAWLKERLERAFADHGMLASSILNRAGWPKRPLPLPHISERDAIKIVEKFLEGQAKAGVRAIFYEPVMSQINLSWRSPPDRIKIGGILAEVSKRSFKRHGILLSILVHQKKAGITRPGSGFLPLARELGLRWSNDDRFLEEQTDKVLQAYA